MHREGMLRPLRFVNARRARPLELREEDRDGVIRAVKEVLACSIGSHHVVAPDHIGPVPTRENLTHLAETQAQVHCLAEDPRGRVWIPENFYQRGRCTADIPPRTLHVNERRGSGLSLRLRPERTPCNAWLQAAVVGRELEAAALDMEVLEEGERRSDVPEEVVVRAQHSGTICLREEGDRVVEVGIDRVVHHHTQFLEHLSLEQLQALGHAPIHLPHFGHPAAPPLRHALLALDRSVDEDTKLMA
mmetsp:Transcript_17497/g.48324  ORF Transcript_17497/g.48324 Transcript_17497/m.48324 type:complete len:246 (+) Transcript_17497:371-1108(+)